MAAIKFEIPDIHANISDFAIIGSGRVKDKVCCFMESTYGVRPSVIYQDSKSFISDVKKHRYTGPRVIVLGSSMRYEIADLIYCELNDNINLCDVIFWDLSPYLNIDGDHAWDNYSFECDSNEYHLVIVDSYYSGHSKLWLSTLIDNIKNEGFSVTLIHPWQECKYRLLTTAKSIILWNGSNPALFEQVKVFLDSIEKKYLYAECGFFPQNENFYLDRAGINVKREMVNDSLSWILPHHYESLNFVKNSFFYDVQAFNIGREYVFCPLQLANDTNVMLNSRFSQGMQEFISYINDYYSSSTLKVIFKPHPKDINAHQYNYGDGIVSHNDSRELILGATKVHGINSTVLFEAALAGKECHVEGDCLLKSNVNSPAKILAAIVALQSSVNIINQNYFNWVITGDF